MCFVCDTIPKKFLYLETIYQSPLKISYGFHNGFVTKLLDSLFFTFYIHKFGND